MNKKLELEQEFNNGNYCYNNFQIKLANILIKNFSKEDTLEIVKTIQEEIDYSIYNHMVEAHNYEEGWYWT